MPKESLNKQAEESRKEDDRIFKVFIKRAQKELQHQLEKNAANPSGIDFDKIELSIREALLLANATGINTAADEIEEQGEDIMELLDIKEKFGFFDTIRGITSRITRGTRAFRGAIDALMGRRPRLKTIADRQADKIDQRSFFVAGFFRRATTKKMKRLLKESLVRGKVDTKRFERRSSKFAGSAKATLENIFRTNIVTMRSAGKRAAFKDPALKGFIVGFMLRATNDDRTRGKKGGIYVTKRSKGRNPGAHWQMNGFIAAVDDPIWDKIWTPNGYQDRCQIIPITITRARRNGWLDVTGLKLNPELFPSYLRGGGGPRVKGLPPVFVKGLFPDKGFKSAPTISVKFLDKRERARIVADRNRMRRKEKRA